MSLSKDCRRIIEVDFPLAQVSGHSSREKSVRHGHPSTLHIWWARRPLAACRAVLLGLLLPDPCDSKCPTDFKAKARSLLAGVSEPPKEDAELRAALLRFISDFSDWDNASNQSYISTAKALVRTVYGDAVPLVVDPFAGGGSIPLEALRLGCDAFASDLNPVACLILKALLEDTQREGKDLAQRLRQVGMQIATHANNELTKYYPKDPDGGRPIAYIWARTVKCEAPNCGAEIPLARSFWLSHHTGPSQGLRYEILRKVGKPPEIIFEISDGRNGREVSRGTVTRGNATCPACRTVLRAERLRALISHQRGGADAVFNDEGHRTGGARVLAVVTTKPGVKGRHFRLPSEHDYRVVYDATKAVAKLSRERLPEGLSQIPDEPLPSPPGKAERTRVAYYNFMPLRLYGFESWGELFATRQKLALVTLVRAVRELPASVPEPVRVLAALAVSRFTDDFSSLTRWMQRGTPGATFTRQALPVLWDYCELFPFDDASWSLAGSFEWVASCIEANDYRHKGQMQLASATSSPLPDGSATVWFTDPPYYDAIPYADLSDFFYVWLRRALPGNTLLHDPFDRSNRLTPKSEEIIDTLSLLRGVSKQEAIQLGLRVKDRKFFEDGMARAFGQGRRVLQEDGIGSVVFAHKTTEGWEALLTGLIRAGWVVTASWPIITERSGRPRAYESAALAASVHLIIRPRPEEAPVGDWGKVMRELPGRVGDWMTRLQFEGIRGADLVFACIGPALEIYSRYSKVETAEGQEISLADYLEKVWEVVGRKSLEQILGPSHAEASEGGTIALEEDARLTALFLWTLQSTATGDEAKLPVSESVDENEEDESEEDEGRDTMRKGGYALPFDIVRRFAQPLGIHITSWEGRIVETSKGVVRLLPLAERVSPLFGGTGSGAAAAGAAHHRRVPIQTTLLPSPDSSKIGPEVGRGKAKPPEKSMPRVELTTLDRVHMAMLLQTSGQSSGLRAFLEEEVRRGPQFLRLANALSALYPRGTEEKRLVDAILVSVPRR